MVRRKDGRWQQELTVTEHGRKRQRFFYGKTKAEVLRKIADYKEQTECGRLFPEVADEWWSEHEPSLAENTKKPYRPALARVKEEFRNDTIQSITSPMVSQFIRRFAKDHADKTVRTQLMVVNLIFKYAVESGDIQFNIAREVSVPDRLPKKKVSSPSASDIGRVKQSVGCTFGLFAYMALYTGMRRGELLALDWNDIDLPNRTITVNKSIYYIKNVPHLKGTKTAKSTGTLPIMDALADKLHPGSGLVFPNQYGTLMSETQFQRQWELYRIESGVTATPHQFRHAYATMLFENNIPPEEAQALLRHAQLGTTMDVYTDLRESKQKQIFQKVYSLDFT